MLAKSSRAARPGCVAETFLIARSRAGARADATGSLLDVLDGYQAWRDNLPPGTADSRTAEILDAVLELRGVVDELAAAGFGRD